MLGSSCFPFPAFGCDEVISSFSSEDDGSVGRLGKNVFPPVIAFFGGAEEDASAFPLLETTFSPSSSFPHPRRPPESLLPLFEIRSFLRRHPHPSPFRRTLLY